MFHFLSTWLKCFYPNSMTTSHGFLPRKVYSEEWEQGESPLRRSDKTSLWTRPTFWDFRKDRDLPHSKMTISGGQFIHFKFQKQSWEKKLKKHLVSLRMPLFGSHMGLKPFHVESCTNITANGSWTTVPRVWLPSQDSEHKLVGPINVRQYANHLIFYLKIIFS